MLTENEYFCSLLLLFKFYTEVHCSLFIKNCVHFLNQRNVMDLQRAGSFKSRIEIRFLFAGCLLI